ncbi:MAG: thermonuclease family protein [Pseudomonadota bacterium]
MSWKPFLAVVALLVLTGCDEAGAPLQPMRVVDGDTIVLGEDRIRLHGIDAPESAQKCRNQAGREWACGKEATRFLVDLIGQNGVECDTRDTDRYGRKVSICYANGRDLNAALVENGLALAYVKYAKDYAAHEARARAARVGVWGGTFQRPEDWRRNGAEAQISRADVGDSGRCQIKGNISSSGRIYHLPGSRWYARTRIDPTRGERWFCTETEAQAAGWRRSG